MARPESKPKTPLAERLRAFRREIGDIDRDDVATKLGVSKSAFASYERGDTEPTASALEAYRQEFGLNVRWLLTADGSMFDEPAKAPKEPVFVEPSLAEQLLAAVDRISRAAETFEHPPQLEQPARKPEVIDVTPVRSTIKYLPQVASAGGGAVVLEEGTLDFDAEDITRELLGLTPTEILMLKIKGDSMEPTLSEGDIVVVDRTKPRNGGLPIDGKIYLVSLEGDLYAKRARYLLGGGFHWASDNDLYDPIVAEGDLLEEKILGQVVWVWRRV